MRRIIVLLAALGMMLSLDKLRIVAGPSSADPLVLASVGFVVLASFTVGELVAQFKIPKITGYIVSGVILGPQVSNILSETIVKEMEVFNTLAIGLIATTAGLELDLSAIRKVARTLFVTVLAKLPLLLVFVGGLAFLLELRFSVLGLSGHAPILALSLVLAVLGIGTSPAISLAVVNESRTSGRLTDLVLAIPVVKDVVVVVALAVAVAVGKTLLQPELSLSTDHLISVAEELAGSILFGAALGAIIIAYIRFVHRDMLFAVLVAVLSAAELTKVFHLELLLAFIVLGFVVRNLSPYQDELLHPLERVSLPIFVVFFTTAGANVELMGTLAILPFALALSGGRALAYFGASWMGATVGKETPTLRRYAWLAYLPQAGVTLGLINVAAWGLPALADPIRRTGLALVALHLLIGPLSLSWALRRVDGKSNGRETARPRLLSGRQEAGPVGDLVPPKSEVEFEPWWSGINLPSPVDEELRQIASRLEAVVVRFRDELVLPVISGTKTTVLRLVPPPQEVATSLRASLSSERSDPLASLEDKAEAVSISLREVLEAASDQIRTPLERVRLRVLPSDSTSCRIRKRIAWVRYVLQRSSRWRNVPMRLIGRVTCEAPLVESFGLSIRNCFLAHGAMVQELGLLADGARSQEEFRSRIDEIHEAYTMSIRSDLDLTLEQTLSAFAFIAERADTPEFPLGQLRYSEIDARVRSEQTAWSKNAPAWRQYMRASYDTVRARVEVSALSEGVEVAVQRHVWSAFEVVGGDLMVLARTLVDRMRGLEDVFAAKAKAHVSEPNGGGQDAQIADVPDRPSSTADRRDAPSVEKTAREIIGGMYPKRDRDRFRGLLMKYRKRARSTELLTEFSRLLENMPERLYVLGPAWTEATNGPPSELSGREVAAAQVAEAAIIGRLIPKLTEAIAKVTEAAVTCENMLDEAVGTASYTVESFIEDREILDVEAARRTSEIGTLTRSRTRVDAFLNDLDARLSQARSEVSAAVDEAQASIESIHRPAAVRPTRVRGAATGTWRHLKDTFSKMRSGLVSVARRLTGGARGLVQDRTVQEWLGGASPQHVDAAGMARYIDRFIKPSQNTKLPGIYVKAFTTTAIEDSRLAVAYQNEMNQLIRAIQPGRFEAFANVLISGEHGSGRTSMINLLELRVGRHRVVRVDPRFYRREDGLVRVLALELGCRIDASSVLSALRGRTHVFLIDDLERYILPTAGGIADLEAFLDIVVSSTSFTHWVVTVERSTLSTLSELCSIENAFGRRFDLAPLSASELRDVVETRRRLSGVTLEFDPSSFLGFALPIGQRRAEANYYHQLAVVSKGNLRSAIYAHLHSLRAMDEGDLKVGAPRSRNLPFLDQLSAESTAVLSLLVRFGPLEPRTLAGSLLTSEGEVEAFALPLVDAGLIARTASRTFAVSPLVESSIVEALKSQRVLPGVL